ncbi:GNAT family N-acetyltransferase [Hoeflea olei]|uniref:GCN5 family acetyltransferase n=1 Tax=Hoeflea olei TaxID=1480615 RepID=A0A1C1YXM0_9HYPH|nr:GNAT family N-acetyltransferase [Hoeflea olei]OCW58304.1 GCN5 family acetyltransferase [Hoeflea olei]
MVTTAAECAADNAEEGPPLPNLAIVRRLEAVGFRAWPAASIQYDGSWQIRLTAGHPSKRLNSVNPLDPSDHDDIEIRIERAARRFDSYDRPLVFRQTPLAPKPLEAHLDAHGWRRFDETIVMTGRIDALDIDGGMDHLPLKDVGRYVDASIAVHGRDPALKPGLTEVLSAIRPPSGLFVLEEEATGPLSTALCVHDNDLAGLFELATRQDVRRAGYGRDVIRAALRWARHRGAQTAWLQVESANIPAVALYKGLGFGEVYRYAYRQKPNGGSDD